MDADVFIPISFFLFLAAVILVPGYLRSKEKERLHETLRVAYEKGQPVPPEMIEALQSNRLRPQPDRDLRRGIVLLCVAAAMVVFGLMLNQISETEGHALWPIVGGAAFPGFIGIGYIAFWLASRRKTA
jgi:hypothetical protein